VGGDDYTPVKPHHVQLIVDVLEKKIGREHDEVSHSNPKPEALLAVPVDRGSM